VAFFAILALIAAGCSGTKGGKGWEKKDGAKKSEDRGGEPAAPWDGGSKAKDAFKKGDDAPAGRPDAREAKREEAHVGGVTPVAGAGKGPKAGILTAGSFDDNLDRAPYFSFLKQFGQDSAVGNLAGRFLGHRLVLTVRDGGNRPVGNARVRIESVDGGPSLDLVSRTDGRVVFLPAWDRIAPDADFRVTVTPPGGGNPVRQTVARDAVEQTVQLPAVQAEPVRQLDLVLVVDTTGSMGNELEYLKAELRNIARAVHDRFPEVDQRYGLVFYRDENMGDEYVTRRFEFTNSLDEVRKNVQAQSAAGGGDPPEAVHRGFEDAVGLQWRTSNAARVLFHVADAPPHSQHMARTMDAVNALRKKGVAMYPVATGRYDPPTEFVMRTSALLTGGQFLFLTDDSGVGDKHDEPHLNNYHVEKLNKLMIRMIASELAGKRIAPERGDILRTVGKPQQ
jgi:hypothetical protein